MLFVANGSNHDGRSSVHERTKLSVITRPIECKVPDEIGDEDDKGRLI